MPKSNNQKPPSDFNDLHVLAGLDVVKAQLYAAMQLPVANDTEESPAPPAESSDRPTLEQALKRFYLITPDSRVWDSAEREVIKKTAFKEWVGKTVFDAWLAHDDRRSITAKEVGQRQAAAAQRGQGGISEALDRYVYIYPTDSVWDDEKLTPIPVNTLRVAIADCYDQWIKHPERKQIDTENLVFDPTQSVDEGTHINMFRGMPLEPVENDNLCEGIIEMVYQLCNGEFEPYDWLLDWLAYPLQNVGAKMATAVLMHSETQGAGKSLLFDGVMRPMYGEYGVTLGQHQLESPYTDWRSRKLFGLFEEIFSRDQKYSHTGTVKQMITGDKHRIEKKFVSGWEEANHMNAVFLSNEIQPFPIEPSDRRFLVIWPNWVLGKELEEKVIAELNNKGVEAFYSYLLRRDLSGFNAHTKPPMTEAKESLIDLSRAGWDVFYRDWKAGRLESPKVPYCHCLMNDLFKAYEKWAQDGKERAMTRNKFSNFIAKRERRRADVDYQFGPNSKVQKGVVLLVDEELFEPPGGNSQKEILGQCIARFREGLNGEGDPDS